jgi:predicted transposase YdaD
MYGPVDGYGRALLLNGGLGTLPLAPLCNLKADELPAVIHRVDERLNQEAPPGLAAKLLTAAFILTGLRFSREVAEQLFEGVVAMRESSTYQMILAEGRGEGQTEEARKVLLSLGGKRLGPPSEATIGRVRAIQQLERLEQLLERLLDVSDWDELLADPPAANGASPQWRYEVNDWRPCRSGPGLRNCVDVPLTPIAW